jgi:hypothetical protein
MRLTKLFNGLAYADAQTDDLDNARKNIANALKWAKTDDDSERANQLSRDLDARDQAARRSAPRPGLVALPADDATDTPPDSGRPTFAASGSVIRRLYSTSRCCRAQSVCTARRKGGAHRRRGEDARAGDHHVVPDYGPESDYAKACGAETFQFPRGLQKRFHVAGEYVADTKPGPGVVGSVRKIEF